MEVWEFSQMKIALDATLLHNQESNALKPKGMQYMVPINI